jgi:hypothetical protein
VIKATTPKYSIPTEPQHQPNKKSSEYKPECVAMGNRCNYEIRECIKTLKTEYSSLKSLWNQEDMIKLGDPKKKGVRNIIRNKEMRRAMADANIAQESFLAKQSKYFNALIKDKEELENEEFNMILERPRKKSPAVDFSKQTDRGRFLNKTQSEIDTRDYNLNISSLGKSPSPNLGKMTPRTDLLTKLPATQSDYNLLNEAKMKFNGALYKTGVDMARESKRQLFNEVPIDTKQIIETERLKRGFMFTHPRTLSPPALNFGKKVGREKPSPRQKLLITPLVDFFSNEPVERGPFGFPLRKKKESTKEDLDGIITGRTANKVFSIKKFKKFLRGKSNENKKITDGDEINQKELSFKSERREPNKENGEKYQLGNGSEGSDESSGDNLNLEFAHAEQELLY